MSKKNEINKEELNLINGGEIGDLDNQQYKCNECNKVWQYDGVVDKCPYCGSTKISKFESPIGIAPIW